MDHLAQELLRLAREKAAVGAGAVGLSLSFLFVVLVLWSCGPFLFFGTRLALPAPREGGREGAGAGGGVGGALGGGLGGEEWKRAIVWNQNVEQSGKDREKWRE